MVFYKTISAFGGEGQFNFYKQYIMKYYSIYASVMAFVKLEVISIKKAVSQYALKSQVYLKGIQATFDELNTIKYGVQLDLDF